VSSKVYFSLEVGVMTVLCLCIWHLA